MAPLGPGDFTLLGHGVTRPEGVAVAPDGSVWASDQGSAAARIDLPALMRRGASGGLPNGINFLPSGELLIANWSGGLQLLDVDAGVVTPYLDEVDGRPLIRTNYVLADAAGFVWGSESTLRPAFRPQDVAAMVDENDGWIFVRRPDGSTEIVADRLCFANGLALSPDGRWLYVAESLSSTVKRGRIRPGGTLGPLEDVHTVAAELLGERPSRVVAGGDMGPILDGLGFDQEANLWITVINWSTLVVVDTAGAASIGACDPTADVLDSPSNVTWGGGDRRTMYVGSTVRASIAAATVAVPGAPQPWETATPAAG